MRISDWSSDVCSSDLTDQVGCVRDFHLAGGERVREQLVSLSDRDHRLRYTIVESEVPLNDYVAEVALKPVTDGNRTFWSWSSRFRPPPGRERELTDLVSQGVYEAGFAAVRALVERRPVPAPARPVALSPSAAGALPGEAIVVNRHGGPEQLHLAPIQAPRPGPGEVRPRQTAIRSEEHPSELH